MRRNRCAAACAACLAVAMVGCVAAPPRTAQSLHADYAAMSCAELAKESRRLVRDRARRQEYLLPEGRRDAAAGRQDAKDRLKIVMRVAREKNC